MARCFDGDELREILTALSATKIFYHYEPVGRKLLGNISK